MFLSTIGTVLGIAGGINSLTGGGITSALGFGDKSPTGAQAQQMADPFSQYRSQLGAQYAGALTPGGQTDIKQMPGYSQFESGVMQPSLEASQRKAAGMGLAQAGQNQQGFMQGLGALGTTASGLSGQFGGGSVSPVGTTAGFYDSAAQEF